MALVALVKFVKMFFEIARNTPCFPTAWEGGRAIEIILPGSLEELDGAIADLAGDGHAAGKACSDLFISASVGLRIITS